MHTKSVEFSIRAVVAALGVALVVGTAPSACAEQIEAEAYAGMSGIVVEACSEGGQNIESISNGDWAEYVVDVPAAGAYEMNFRVASNQDGASIEVVIGRTSYGTVSVGDTGGWQTWTTVRLSTIFSIPGSSRVRLRFAGGSGDLLNLNWFSLAPPAPIGLTIDTERRQRMKYGLDYERLWFWYGSQANKNTVAKWSVVDCDIDYIRVAINAAYELEEGVYNESAYTSKILPMIAAMKAANPNVKLFASPRPLNEAVDGAPWCPYPLWINIYDGNSFVEFKWLKCAQYLVRYVQFMKARGFGIDYLDLTNEWNNVRPDDAKAIRDYMRGVLGDDMPLIVAPSAWSFWQGYLWLNSAARDDLLDGFDIASCHNTGYQGTAADFANKALSLGKEVWDSEVHGWKGKVPADEIPTSYHMFERIRAGFSGLDAWLSIGTPAQQHCFILNNGSTVTRNVKYYIFRKLCRTSNYGHALTIDQPSELTSTAALLRGNLLTVWVLNNSAASLSDVTFTVEDRRIAETSIRRTRWHESVALEGGADTVVATSDTRFMSTIQPNSLYCFEIELEYAGLPLTRIEAEDFDAQAGTQLEACTDDGGGLNVAHIVDGSWCRFDQLTLTTGMVFQVRVARSVGSPDSQIEVRLDSLSGPLLGSFQVPETGGGQDWETLETTLGPVSGEHSIHLRFVGEGGGRGGVLLNLNWLALPLFAPPGDLQAEPLDATRIDLDWSAPEFASGYTLKRSGTSGGPYTILAAGLTSTQHTDTALSAGADYYYVVSALYDGVESANSEEVRAVPSAPIRSEDVVMQAVGVDPEGPADRNVSLIIPTTGLGHDYQVRSTAHLIEPDWRVVTGMLPGTGGELRIEIPIDAVQSNQFYRLDVQRR